MAISASEAQPDRLYRLTRGGGENEYYTLHPWPVERMVRKLSARRSSLKIPMVSLLCRLVGEPGLVLFNRHMRGTDPLTGKRYETVAVAAFAPDIRLREVKSPPGYR